LKKFFCNIFVIFLPRFILPEKVSFLGRNFAYFPLVSWRLANARMKLICKNKAEFPAQKQQFFQF